MKTPLLIASAVLFFGIGLAINAALDRSAKTDRGDDASVANVDSPQNKKERWRNRFLSILEEPSTSLQMASFYALATEIPPDEMAYALEAIYPEGWVRHRGDLPLAISMEWIRQGGKGMAGTLDRLYRKYPELEDNIDNVFYNLGLQEDAGAIPVLKALAESELRSVVVNAYIDGVRQKNPNAVFQARFALLSPQIVFSNLRQEEFEAALNTFWEQSESLLSQNVQPSHMLWFELGKQYGSSALTRIPAESRTLPLLIGLLVSADVSAASIEEELAGQWFNNYGMFVFLSQQDARTVLEEFFGRQALAKHLTSNALEPLWQIGLDRPLALSMISRPNLDPALRATILAKAAPLLKESELAVNLPNLSPFARDQVVLAKLNSSHESKDWIQDLPEEWLSPRVARRGIELFIQSRDASGLHDFANRIDDLSEALPQHPMQSGGLWELAPELYLEGISTLPPESQAYHISMIAGQAEAEEVAVLLEASPLHKENDVLINLIPWKPDLALQVLDSSELTPEQGILLGQSLPSAENLPSDFSFFQGEKMDSLSRQLSFVTYYAKQLEYGPEFFGPLPSTQDNPDLDYLSRFTNAVVSNSNNIAQLEALKQERPSQFLDLLVHQVDSLQQLAPKANQLLTSPTLTEEERERLHLALYAGPQQ